MRKKLTAYEKISRQLQKNPEESVASIAERLGVSPAAYYAGKRKRGEDGSKRAEAPKAASQRRIPRETRRPNVFQRILNSKLGAEDKVEILKELVTD